jgi:transposase-like protein
MNSSNNGLVRRRKTPEERQQLVAGFRESQLTQRDFATRESIGLSTLSKWLRIEGRPKPHRIKFQEVVLPHTPQTHAIEIVSPNGWTVRLQNSSDAASLSKLLQALPC